MYADDHTNFNLLTRLAGLSSPDKTRLNGLGELEGLTMHSAFQGSFECGGTTAQVVMEPSDSITLRLRVKGSLAPERALGINHSLPGNLRYAAAQDGVCLLADLPFDGAADLRQSFGELRRVMALAVGTLKNLLAEDGLPSPSQIDMDGLGRPSSACDETMLAQAIDGLQWPADSIVRHDQAWELRPKVQGQSVPVRLEIVQGQVQIHTVVLQLAECEQLEAVAHQALRENALLRGARLAEANGAIVAETRVGETMLAPRLLADAVTAVAVAKARTAAVLEALTNEPELARWYERLFAAELPAAVPS